MAQNGMELNKSKFPEAKEVGGGGRVSVEGGG